MFYRLRKVVFILSQKLHSVALDVLCVKNIKFWFFSAFAFFFDIIEVICHKLSEHRHITQICILCCINSHVFSQKHKLFSLADKPFKLTNQMSFITDAVVIGFVECIQCKIFVRHRIIVHSCELPYIV